MADTPAPAAAAPAPPPAAADSTPPFPQHRTAILVIHGMGAQKPYTTLDQFARGIIGVYGLPNIQQQVRFRHWSDTSIGNQKDWTQTLLRIAPAAAAPGDTTQLIDVYEYYWAPVITGLVTARQSLQFLLFTALTPFQYLRENLAAIDAAAQRQQGRALSRREAANSSVFILFRELARMAFIFVPFIVVFLVLLWLVVDPFTPSNSAANDTLRKLFQHWPLKPLDLVKLLLAGVRYLFLFMAASFLAGEIPALFTSQPARRKPWAYVAVMSLLFVALLFFPLWLPFSSLAAAAMELLAFARSQPWRAFEIAAPILVLALFLLNLTTLFDPWKAAFARGWNAVKHGWKKFLACLAIAFALLAASYRCSSLAQSFIALPAIVLGKSVLKLALLAAVLYALRAFLTSAIGGLAVYLGADALSKNSAARSQILHESTQTLLKILEPHFDLALPATPGTSARPGEYDRVLIAAHSLGSVIALDMLNQLIVRKEARDPALVGNSPAVPAPNLSKIAGLLTFGSPLNKVVYFFSTRTSALTTVLERILFVLHPFRLKVPPSAGANTPATLNFPYPNPSPFGPAGNFRWINAWSRFDIISGPMFFYDSNADPIVERGVAPWTAHLSYWENGQLYTLFAQHLL